MQDPRAGLSCLHYFLLCQGLCYDTPCQDTPCLLCHTPCQELSECLQCTLQVPFRTLETSPRSHSVALDLFVILGPDLLGALQYASCLDLQNVASGDGHAYCSRRSDGRWATGGWCLSAAFGPLDCWWLGGVCPASVRDWARAWPSNGDLEPTALLADAESKTVRAAFRHLCSVGAPTCSLLCKLYKDGGLVKENSSTLSGTGTGQREVSPYSKLGGSAEHVPACCGTKALRRADSAGLGNPPAQHFPPLATLWKLTFWMCAVHVALDWIVFAVFHIYSCSAEATRGSPGKCVFIRYLQLPGRKRAYSAQRVAGQRKKLTIRMRSRLQGARRQKVALVAKAGLLMLALILLYGVMHFEQVVRYGEASNPGPTDPGYWGHFRPLPPIAIPTSADTTMPAQPPPSDPVGFDAGGSPAAPHPEPAAATANFDVLLDRGLFRPLPPTAPVLPPPSEPPAPEHPAAQVERSVCNAPFTLPSGADSWVITTANVTSLWTQWGETLQLPGAVIGLQETRLTKAGQEYMNSIFKERGWTLIHGEPLPEKNDSLYYCSAGGVAIAAPPGIALQKVQAASTLEAELIASTRFVHAAAAYGSGEDCLHIFCIYGHSGARGDSDRMRANEHLLASTFAVAAEPSRL